jgi:hypothetical protein
MKKTKHIFCKTLLLICIFIIGCSSKPAPLQVHGTLRFGPYNIAPPAGYWYYQRKYPKTFKLPVKTSKDFFLESFFENKDTLLKNTRNGVFKKIPRGQPLTSDRLNANIGAIMTN